MKRWLDINEIRRINARAIAERIGMDRLTLRLGVTRQRVHSVIGNKPRANIGDELARRIERIGNKPKNWLDNDHGWRSKRRDGR